MHRKLRIDQKEKQRLSSTLERKLNWTCKEAAKAESIMPSIKFYSTLSAAVIILSALQVAAAERPIRKCHFKEKPISVAAARLRPTQCTGTRRPESKISGRFFVIFQYWYFVTVSAEQRQARTHQEVVFTNNTFAFHTFRCHPTTSSPNVDILAFCVIFSSLFFSSNPLFALASSFADTKHS